jgi:hypothetical protein
VDGEQVTEKKPNVFVGVPTYDGWIHSGLIEPLMKFRTVYPSMLTVCGGSLLAYQFNSLWLAALNSSADYFIMCHADITPEMDAFQKLVEECIRLDADVVSVVSPIKTPDGITSTGIADEETLWHPRRFTMREVFTFPDTFTAADTGHPDKALLINTGLMVCSVKRPWAANAHFTIKDKIGEFRGERQPLVLPEDWGFSWYLHENNAKVYATRKVSLDHHGNMAFPNTSAWGTYEHDPAHPEAWPDGKVIAA